jgi:hypothetical protein
MFLLIALVTALVGASPLVIAKMFRPFTFVGIIYFLISWWAYYALMPSLEYSIYGWISVWVLVLTIISLIITATVNDGDNRIWPSLTPPGGIAVVIIVVLFTGYGGCGSNDAKYAALPGNLTNTTDTGKVFKHWTQHTSPVSATDIPYVPIETALMKGQSALNQNDKDGNNIGSQFEIAKDYVTKQKIGNQLYYALPLDYTTWGSYRNMKNSGAPGFVLVNAEDKDANPIYLNKYHLRYTPEAFWGDNLERHLYENGYAGKILMDYSFEVDDNFRPWWVVTVCHHTIGMFSGVVVDGIVIVDPQSGDITYKQKGKDVPEWVDRVVPSEIVNTNIHYWGRFLKGWSNQCIWGSHLDLRKPETTVLNYGADNSCWYVTPVTSTKNNSAKDASGNKVSGTMTDLIYTNTRSGESYRYSVSGFTEESILSAVNAKVKYLNVTGSGVVYLNVMDRLTALVTLLATDHSIYGVAFVDVESKSLELSQSQNEKPQTTLTKYRTMISKLPSAISTDIATDKAWFAGKVSRIQLFPTTGIYYMYFANRDQLFAVPSELTKILVTQVGDSIKVRFVDVPTQIVTVDSFENYNIHLRASKNEEVVANRNQKNADMNQTERTRTSTKHSIMNGEVPDAVLDKVHKEMKNK